MKKLIAIMLVLVLALSMAACGGNKGSGGNENPTEFTAKGGTMRFLGFEPANKGLTSDENAMLFKFEFDCTSDEAVQFQQVFSVKFFQNGVQSKNVSSWSSDGGEQYDLVNNYFTQVMNGGKLTFAMPAVLKDDSIVTIMASDIADSKNTWSMEVDVKAAAPVSSEADGAEAQQPVPEPVPEPVIENLALGQVYTGDDLEVTVNQVYFTNECKVQLTSHSSTSKRASEGNTIIAVESLVKNIATDTLDRWSTNPFEVYVMYDGKYKYDSFSFVGEKEIAPLASKTECAAVEVPKDIKNAEEPLEVFVTIGSKTYRYAIREAVPEEAAAEEEIPGDSSAEEVASEDAAADEAVPEE